MIDWIADHIDAIAALTVIAAFLGLIAFSFAVGVQGP